MEILTKFYQIILFLFISTSCLADYPQAENEYINDFAGMISHNDEQNLTKKLKKLEHETGIELSVVTLDSYNKYQTGATSWEDFSTGLFNYWGVGNTQHNNGVLFLISKNDRKVRIELGGGYPSHYNQIMKEVIDDKVVTMFKQNNYSAGVQAGVDGIISATTVKVSFREFYKWHIIAGILASISLIIAIFVKRSHDPHIFWMILGSAGFIIIFIITSIIFGERSSGFGGGSSSGGGASGSW